MSCLTWFLLQGAGIKIGSSQNNATGGLVVNVTWINVTITQTRHAPLYVDVFGEDVPTCALPPDPVRPGWLTAANISFQNVSAVVASGQAAGCFICSPSSPCKGFQFLGVTAKTSSGVAAAPYKCFNFVDASSAGSMPVPCGLVL